MLPSINFLSVIAATVVSIVIGFAWYSMAVFGKPWIKLVGLTKADLEKNKKDMGLKYALMVVASLVMAYVLAVLIELLYSITIIGGAKVGVLVWLGFVATLGLNSYIFENKPINLYLINVGYYLIALVVMGAILAAWPY